MSVIKEFREFISRGNVIDLAVGVIIGAAFNGIVKSLVDQVIMPPIGLLTGGLDFSKLEWVLKPEDPATATIEKVSVQYGAFINTLIQFLIVAVVVFLLVKAVNSIRRADAAEPAPEAPTAPTAQEALLMEIRDLLAKAPVPAPVPAATPVVTQASTKPPIAKPAAKPAARAKPKA